MTKLTKKKMHTRYKDKKGNLVPGVTTICGLLNKPFLLPAAVKLALDGKDYKEVWGAKAHAGTLAHAMIVAFLKTGEELDTSEYSQSEIDKAENSILSFFSWTANHTIKPILIEHAIVSDYLGCGGTLDLYCECNGKKTLIDLKSGKLWPEHLYQLAAYYNLLKREGHKVEQVICLSIPRDETDSFEQKCYNQEELDLGYQIFLNLLGVYKLRKQLKEKA